MKNGDIFERVESAPPEVSLGQRLTQNIERRKAELDERCQADLERAREELQSKQSIVRSFFDAARKRFTEGILAGESTDTLFVQVGGSEKASGNDWPFTRAQHRHVFALFMEAQARSSVSGICMPAALVPAEASRADGDYAALWREFQDWASAQGLEASWVSRRGYGDDISNWWELLVKPVGPNS